MIIKFFKTAIFVLLVVVFVYLILASMDFIFSFAKALFEDPEFFTVNKKIGAVSIFCYILYKVVVLLGDFVEGIKEGYKNPNKSLKNNKNVEIKINKNYFSVWYETSFWKKWFK